MDDKRGEEHDEVNALLPDYAVGQMSDVDILRVSVHLDSCATCQRDLAYILEVVTLLAKEEVPSPTVKWEVLTRATPSLRTTATASGPVTTDRPASQPGSSPITDTGASVSAPRRAPLWLHPAILAPAAVLALLIVGFVFRELVLDRGDDDRDDRAIVAELLLDSEAVHPLADSELDVGAAGLMYADPSSSVGYLVAHGLSAPPPGQEYRVWLFTQDGRRIDAGPIPVDADGVGQTIVRAPSAFADYWAVGVSLEPVGGSPEPTSPLVVGGWIQ